MLGRIWQPTSRTLNRQARLLATGALHSVGTSDNRFAKWYFNAGLLGAFGLAGISYSAVGSGNAAQCQSTAEVTVGKDSDFVDGELYEVPVGDDKHVLISRHEGKLHAVGSRCSHYGYPLVKGVKCENEVVCALHDAAFDITTGKPIRGPGLDALPTYPVRVGKGGEVFVSIPCGEFPAKVSLPMAKRDLKNLKTFVIVGGGPAGLTAAETLRQEGFTGRILLLSQENHLPYDRPVLSKKLPVKGKIDGLYLRSASHFAEADIEVRLNARVDLVDPIEKVVVVGSEKISYDKCLVATGGSPRELFIPGAASAKNVHVFRTIEDALAVSDLEKGQKIVVIGGSFIGMELASTLIQKGIDVTIVAKTAVPYEKVLGKKVGAFFANLLSEREVRYIGNSAVKIIRRDPSTGAVNAVELDDGDVLPADAVVIGAGLIPNVPVSSAVRRLSDGSLAVTPFLNSRENPDLFAAGDICTFPYAKTGEDLRVEHWDVALQQGRVAAKNMLDQHVPFNEIPYFWTMVFGKSLRYVGNVGSEGITFENVFIEGDLAKGEFVAYYTKKNTVAAVATVGRDPVAVACGELMRLGLMPSPAELQLGTINADGILARLKEVNDKKKKIKLLKSVSR